ncbi:DUF1929-domain-containing protein [Cantharellus anzutake]|uniref:DUF1929-domain-containing protein n=1 Tax=Cantharellus anzutake TaxID=1750568 RepID=UPI001903741E|nr:DUF1929-domain-containing protein [Cantharellus anzutake]KAF8334022.1 DUF1929-domain-containing protein [Cantharellus anzutake]
MSSSLSALRRLRTALILFVTSTSLFTSTARADPTPVPPPGQPSRTGPANTFQVIGTSGVSAQQLFLGTANKVYVVDKTEDNPLRIKSHPAWGSEITLNPTYSVRAMDIYSNTFCAGGSSLGDGRWINVGGNEGVSWGGVAPGVQGNNPAAYGGAPYDDYDGGAAIRLLMPRDDGTCNWDDNPKNYMSSRRWYPTVEPLEDGSVVIIGGDNIGGYLNSADQNNPTLEYWPSKGNGTPVYLPILDETLPANLFPLTWLLPSGNLFIQVNWETEVYDYKNNVEHRLANIPAAVRTYPASGASVLLPLTPANNYTATVLFCGGSNVAAGQWTSSNWIVPTYPASTSCVKINPDDKKPVWVNDAVLPEARTMGNFILLPDGRILLVNGAKLGTAGYGNDSWAIGHSYADSPILTPLIYDPHPGIPTSRRLSRAGLGSSKIPRMYHSTAILLTDGSVMIAGSNPNPDYTVGNGVQYPTEYRVELFYPWYFNYTRPNPSGLIDQIGYGGNYFDVQLSADDLKINDGGNGPLYSLNGTKAILIRTGFSTHGLNMGQRYLELQTSYTLNSDGSGILHVAQFPPLPTLFPPGPAVLYIVVNGVPSVGVLVTVGNGQIGTQTVNTVTPLPGNVVPVPTTSTGTLTTIGPKSTGRWWWWWWDC